MHLPSHVFLECIVCVALVDGQDQSQYGNHPGNFNVHLTKEKSE